MFDKGKKIKISEIQYGWCEAEESWLPMTECSGCIYHFFDDTSHYCRWEKPERKNLLERRTRKQGVQTDYPHGGSYEEDSEE